MAESKEGLSDSAKQFVRDFKQEVLSEQDTQAAYKMIRATNEVLMFLKNLGGFDHWWDGIDGPTQKEIHEGITTTLIKSLAAPI